MTDHQLKIVPYWFNKTVQGEKGWEIRKNDRDYKPGDWLILFEYNERGLKPGYSGKGIAVEVLSVDYSDFLPSRDFVIMTIGPPEEIAEEYQDTLSAIISNQSLFKA